MVAGIVLAVGVVAVAPPAGAGPNTGKSRKGVTVFIDVACT
jgi:hypothetical protein